MDKESGAKFKFCLSIQWNKLAKWNWNTFKEVQAETEEQLNNLIDLVDQELHECLEEYDSKQKRKTSHSFADITQLARQISTIKKELERIAEKAGHD